MGNFSTAIFFVFFDFLSVLNGIQHSEVKYTFVQQSNYYSFYGSFFSNADPDSIINVIYDFRQLRGFTTGAKSIELMQQGNSWYDVEYTYRKFLIFESKSVWRRTLKRDEATVLFEMRSNNNNLKIMPKIISSTGYYKVKHENDGSFVEYFQECKLKAGVLESRYINTAKKEAIKFIKEFEKYLEKVCQSSGE